MIVVYHTQGYSQSWLVAAIHAAARVNKTGIVAESLRESDIRKKVSSLMSSQCSDRTDIFVITDTRTFPSSGTNPSNHTCVYSIGAFHGAYLASILNKEFGLSDAWLEHYLHRFNSPLEKFWAEMNEDDFELILSDAF